MNKKQENKFEDYKKRLEEINKSEGTDYIMIGEYRGCNEKMLFSVTDKKNNGKKIFFEMRPGNFFNNGHRGPQGLFKNKGLNKFNEEVRNLVGSEYTVLGEYINNSTGILMRHEKCRI